MNDGETLARALLGYLFVRRAQVSCHRGIPHLAALFLATADTQLFYFGKFVENFDQPVDSYRRPKDSE
jgi:hypothetical protein